MAALRWWSTLESMLLNLTIFDRAEDRLDLEEQRSLAVGDPAVTAAAELRGLA